MRQIHKIKEAYEPQCSKNMFNSLPNDKIWAFTKLEAFADDNSMLVNC